MTVIRDKLNSIEGYQEIINRNINYISEDFDAIKKLEESEKKGIQLYRFSNNQVIFNNYCEILEYQCANFKAGYSLGKNLEDLKIEYYSIVSTMEHCWEQESGYIEMIWMLSIGKMLEIENAVIFKLIEIVKKDNPKDYLVDFLIQSYLPSWKIDSDKLKFNIPYKATQEIISLARISKEKALDRQRKYLTKEWYRGHSDTGWYNNHKSEGNFHTGYWSFESGALVKILGLDDSSLKGMPYYPYDMVHWADKKNGNA
jgi:hypothetical protein